MSNEHLWSVCRFLGQCFFQFLASSQGTEFIKQCQQSIYTHKLWKVSKWWDFNLLSFALVITENQCSRMCIDGHCYEDYFLLNGALKKDALQLHFYTIIDTDSQFLTEPSCELCQIYRCFNRWRDTGGMACVGSHISCWVGYDRGRICLPLTSLSSSSDCSTPNHCKHEPREPIKSLKCRPLKLLCNEYLKAFTSYYKVTFYSLNELSND